VLAAAFGGVAAGPDALPKAELVVNATSAGLDGRSSPLPPKARFNRGALAYDLVYKPKLTPFLKKAKAAGARTAGGSGMLVLQAAEAWRIWFREPLPPAALKKGESAIISRLR
jgi:shikimate dehydrogenase